MDEDPTLPPYALDLSPAFALVLIAATAMQLANSAMIALKHRQMQDHALDAVHSQSWHLQQLLPERADERSA